MSSRHSGSSRHRSHQSKASSQPNPEVMVEEIKGIVALLYEVVASHSDQWETYLPSARSAMAALDHLRFFRDPARFAEQVWIIQGLQNYAFYDAENACVRDVAEHCQASWLRVLRNYPESVDTLAANLSNGLGNNWLQRSQATMSRIYQEEGNDSGSSGGQGADPRRQGPLYSEARGYLQASVDFYKRAIDAAECLGATTGELLSSAADAHRTLGHVTASPGDQRHFDKAIRYLRQAEEIPGFILSESDQNLLEEYGRYV